MEYKQESSYDKNLFNGKTWIVAVISHMSSLFVCAAIDYIVYLALKFIALNDSITLTEAMIMCAIGGIIYSNLKIIEMGYRFTMRLSGKKDIDFDIKKEVK